MWILATVVDFSVSTKTWFEFGTALAVFLYIYLADKRDCRNARAHSKRADKRW